MSAVLIPGKLLLVVPAAGGDARTSVQAGTVDDPGISCDTVADLPSPTYFDGYTLMQESTAHVVTDNTIYTMLSDGTWILQDEASRLNVYTKPQIDSMLSDYTTTADQMVIDGAQDGEILSLSQILGNLKYVQIDRNTVSNFIGFRLTDTDNHMIRIIFGKLNATTNYVQFYGGDGALIDKGYITFDVSRNIDTWS